MKENLTPEALAQFSDAFDAKESNALAMNAVTAAGINACAVNYAAIRKYRNAFSVEVEAGDITNQKQSGRCWMFAALNVMRLDVMKKLNLKNMELSQNYPLFFDKLEKANYFLENILETMDEPTDGRVIAYLLQSPVGDGGQWDMFSSLVEKYGVVPKECMPETVASSATRELDRYLTVKLREYACTLRNAHGAGEGEDALRARKDDMMATVYRMLCIALGKPPKTVTWEGRDKDNKFFRIEGLTPRAFFDQYVGWNLDDYVTVINAPTDDKPYGRTYTVQYLGNVRGGKYPVKYLNLPVEDLKAIAIAQLKDGKAVWFGSDVGQSSTRDTGLMAPDALAVGPLLGTDFPLTKAQRLDYGDSQMTHAMVLTGVNLDAEGKPDRWKVENSWGKDPGYDGFFVMSDDWFSEFTYQILLHKKYFTKEQRAMFDSAPIVLKPWDPMGSLAK